MTQPSSESTAVESPTKPKPNRIAVAAGIVLFAVTPFVLWGKVASRTPDNVQAATGWVACVWTGGTANGLRFRLGVEKDGTYSLRSAMANQRSWGEPEWGRWTVEERKYVNTGEHFLLLRAGIDGDFALKDGKLHMFNDSGEMVVALRRGDHFPY